MRKQSKVEQKVDNLQRWGLSERKKICQRGKQLQQIEREREREDKWSNMRAAFSDNWWSVLNSASSVLIHFAVYFHPERFISCFLLFNYTSDSLFNYVGFFSYLCNHLWFFMHNEIFKCINLLPGRSLWPRLCLMRFFSLTESWTVLTTFIVFIVFSWCRHVKPFEAKIKVIKGWKSTLL